MAWPLRTRDLAEGAAWGLVVGALGGVIVTGSTITAEAGQVLWLMTVIAGAVVIAPAGGETMRASAGACLPFFLALCCVLAWTGAAGLAWSVGRAILISRVTVPIAAYTERDMAFRHGIFFIFLIGASLPAVIGTLIACHGTAGLVRRLAAGTRPGSVLAERLRVTLRLAVRLMVCAGMLALATIS